MNARSDPPPRAPHVICDQASRIRKSIKIERILRLHERGADASSEIRLLDVGTGSGYIARYFAAHPDLKCRVDAVDMADNRQIREGYSFWQVTDTTLPFPDASFDVVISNHVIEHVGSTPEQRRHLTELKRVLRPEGVIYLAVPNCWMLVEPHYQIAFLSWLPVAWRTPYLRWRGKGYFYDCDPLTLRQLEKFVRDAGFEAQNASIEATRLFFEIEKPDSLAGKILRKCPDALLSPPARDYSNADLCLDQGVVSEGQEAQAAA